MASEYLLARLQCVEKFREQIVIYPELTLRESTAAVAHADDAPDSPRKPRRGSEEQECIPQGSDWRPCQGMTVA